MAYYSLDMKARARALKFYDEPVFCFTSDIDWAPEWAISETWRFFDNMGVPLTPFVTHKSNTIHERFGQANMRPRVGLHPNFLASSTHGKTILEVVSFVQALWPEAVSFRSHSFFDSTHVTDAFREQGFKYDSNLCLFLQPDCVPLRHNSGMLRFPVFWEDDYHFARGFSFDLDMIERHLDAPGLKVFNIHPFHFALNIPSLEYYTAHKNSTDSLDDKLWHNSVFAGRGVRMFVEDVLDYVKAKGYRNEYLHDLFLQIVQEQPVAAYKTASTEQRADIVRHTYDKKDSTQIYATSRDFNLRELEVSFITKHVTPGRILDIGCGNGFTILSLAKKMQAEFIGLDFSTNMIKGAEKMRDEFSKELKCHPQFRVCDVRRLPFEDNSFDCVISERCLLNLPSRQDQYDTIREVHRVLRNEGVFLMVEGTEDGLLRLNQVRQQVGLEAIPSVAPDNVSSLKFHEEEIDNFLKQLFHIEVKQFFGTYYLISRVVHPLLVYPEEPKFDAKINSIARRVAEVIPDVGRLGHVMGYKLVARKPD